MGLRGPKPQPTRLRLLRGNPGKRPLPKDEPQPRRVMPPGITPTRDEIAAEAFMPPGPADEGALKVWRYLVEITSRMGVLTEADGLALWDLGCHLRQIFELEDLSLQMRAKGDHLGGLLWRKRREDGSTDPNAYPVVSPVFYARRPLITEALNLFREFGLTPSSRTRVQSLGAAEHEKIGGLLDGEWRPSEPRPVKLKRKCASTTNQIA